MLSILIIFVVWVFVTSRNMQQVCHDEGVDCAQEGFGTFLKLHNEVPHGAGQIVAEALSTMNYYQVRWLRI